MIELLIYFIPVKPIDIVDILLVAILLYQLHKQIRGTTAVNIFIGILTIYILWKIVTMLEMKLLSEILGQFFSIGFLALIIVFQQEIRKFLLMLGSPKFIRSGVFKSKKNRWHVNRTLLINFDAIVQSCRELSLDKVGALIIITKHNIINHYIDTGQKLDANISKEILESIFLKTSPLHDGAVIISGNKIKAVRCILPISDRSDMPAIYGLRHRAAIGVTEHSDALAIVVSEQTGNISFCSKGDMHYNITASELKFHLKREFKS